MGAARRHLDRLAARAARLAEQAGADPGSTARWSADARERVRILIDDAAAEKRARALLARVGADLTSVDFFRAPTDRSWTRDYCPLFVKDARGGIAITNWRFNGWAKYPNHKRDDAVTDKIARRFQLRQWHPRP